MQDGVSAVNDLVTKTAEELKQKANTGGENQNENKSVDQVEKEKADAEAARVAGEQKVAAENAEKEKQAKEGQKEDPIAELLKQTKFKTKEELVEHLNKKDKKVESPEEKKRNEEIYRANLNQFAVENELMSNEDIVKLETLKVRADKELVFEKFSKEIVDEITDEAKEENPTVTQEEIDTRIKEAFDKEYPLESKNQKAKTRAENKLAKEAKDLRSPLESSFTEAQKRYNEEVEIRNTYPEYKKSIVNIISEKVPSTVSFFKDKDGNDEISIDIPVSAEDKKEIIDSITKKLLIPETYGLYKDGKSEDLKAMAEQELEYLVNKKFGELGKKEIAKKFMSRGLEKGSTVGAKQSFATNQAKAGAAEKPSPADAEQQVIDSTRQKT